METRPVIILLQRLTIKGVVHEIGHRFDYSKKRAAWFRDNKINHSVLGFK